MNKKQKQEYKAPMVERLEARVEKGFQSSGQPTESQPQGSNEALTANSDSYSGNDFD